MKHIRNLLILLILVGIFFIYLNRESFVKTTNTNTIYFTIKEGTSLYNIAENLKKSDIIGSKELFIAYAKFNHMERDLKAGDYLIPPKTSFRTVLLKFQKGQSDYLKITFPEGYTFYQITKKLEETHLWSQKEFLHLNVNQFDWGSAYPLHKNVPYPLEGYLFPDTYHIPLNASAQYVINLMHQHMEQIFSQEYRAQSKRMKLSLQQVLTIASLIEKEAAYDGERKKIAGVIYNRLQKGMPLQIDASVIYGITKGEKSLSKLYYKDLESRSPYNLYKVKGLPPSPIACPGKTSIEAALYPESHNYLYYVLGEGQHVFSQTYEQHQINVKKYIK